MEQNDMDQTTFEQAKVFFMRGLEHMRNDEWELAEIALRTSLSFVPDRPSTLTNLSASLIQLERWSDALVMAERAVELDPVNSDAWFNRGTVHEHEQKYADAVSDYLKVTQLSPKYKEAWRNLSLLYTEMKQAERALPCLDQWLALAPDDAEVYLCRGIVLKDLKRTAEAVGSLDMALTLAPWLVQAHANRAVALQDLGRYEDALQGYDRAIELEPNYVLAHYNRGTVMRDLGRLPEALESFEKAVYLDPTHADALNNRGLCQLEMGLPDLALTDYGLALVARPEFSGAIFNQSLALLTLSCFDQAWLGYGQRNAVEGAKQPGWLSGVRIWSGGVPQGRVLLVAEQGIGDEVFHTKGLGLYIERYGAPACVTVDRRLVPVFERSFPGIKFFDRMRVAELDPGDFDVQIALGDLGILLHSDPIRMPELASSHLRADPSRSELTVALGARGRRPRVGVSWKSKNAKLGESKSMALMEMMRELREVDADWVNLQYDDVDEEIEQVRAELGVTIHRVAAVDVTQDLEGLLGLIRDCDVVITTSNSTAHLCGALGRPGVVLVPFGKGKLWYWHLKDGPAIWYPSLELCHARQPDVWAWAKARVAIQAVIG